MSATSRRKKRIRSKNKHKSKKRIEAEELKALIKIATSLRFSSFSRDYILAFNYFLSVLLWSGALSFIVLFFLIFITSTKEIGTTSSYFLSFNNPGIWFLSTIPLYFLIVFIVHFIHLQKNRYSLVAKSILDNQIWQINFIVPTCFAVWLLTVDRVIK